jgi:hypothetical protein
MIVTDGHEIVQRLLTDKPLFHRGGEVRWDALPGTLEAIRSSVRPGDTTLEVGVGASTVVFTACGAKHTAISPDPSEHERVREYLHSIDVDDSGLTFATGLSDDVLPQLLTRQRTLDMGFVDGAHSFPCPVVDWYYVARSLKVGGKMLVDDIPIPAAGQLFQHMNLESHWRLEGVFDNRSALFILVELPSDVDEWQEQAYNRHYPDFSFAGMPERMRLTATARAVQIRYRIGQRYPGLRRFYKTR